jgi:flavodoxin
MSKVLVVYYSFEGATELIAESISHAMRFDILSIKPVKEIKSKGFSKYVWGGGQVVMGIVPKIEPIQIDLDAYDTILLGSPIWAGTFAPPLRTFLENEKVRNKRIAYFYTHDGGASLAVERAKEAISKHNTFIASLGLENVRHNQESSKKQAIDWAKSIL